MTAPGVTCLENRHRPWLLSEANTFNLHTPQPGEIFLDIWPSNVTDSVQKPPLHPLGQVLQRSGHMDTPHQ